MIQLSRTGTVVSGSPADLERLRDQFEREHLVLLPRFLDPGLFQFIQSDIHRAEFQEYVHDHLVPPARELVMNGGLAPGLLELLLMNDPKLFDAMQRICGSGAIGSFTGRVYRMLPGPEHHDAWHDDVGHARMIAISVNLSTDVYAGGVLEIRDRESHTVVREIANTGAGDAIVFRVSPRLEHRVTEVTGAVPKTAYAGWFCAEPVFDLLTHIRTSAAPPAR